MYTAQDHKQMVRRFFDALNYPDWEQRLEQIFSQADYDYFVPLFKPFREAFPDYHAEIQEIIAEGDQVVTWVKVSGSMQGEFEDGGLKGVKPSGQRAEWDEVMIERIHEDGRYDVNLFMVDETSRMRQLTAETTVPSGED